MDYRYCWDKEYIVATPILVIGHPGKLVNVLCENGMHTTLRFATYPKFSAICYDCNCGGRHMKTLSALTWK